MTRGRILGLVLLLVVAAVVAVDRCAPVQDAIVRRIVAARVRQVRTDLLEPDALRVAFCGTGSPLLDPDRAQACTVIFAGDRMLLVDAGTGAADSLQHLHLPQGRLAMVLITHFHSDHINGLPDVVLGSWASGRREPLRIVGGPGIEEVTNGFRMATRQDARYRTAHHGADVMPPEGAEMRAETVTIPPDTDARVVLEEGELRVTAFRVHHLPADPAYGYRIDWGGRSVVVSGDTTPVPSLVSAARGADVLVHESLAPHVLSAVIARLEAIGDTQRARILGDVPDYHTTAVDAARQANASGVRLLVLSHLIPPATGRVAERIFLRGVEAERPEGVTLAWDGLLLELPRDGTEIRERSLD